MKTIAGVYPSAMIELSESIIHQIRDDYLNKVASLPKLCIQYQVKYSRVLTHFKKMEVPLANGGRGKRKYPCNEDYFSVIDTEEKSYILGLLMADGCVSIHKRNNYRVTLTLTRSDEKLVIWVRNKLAPTMPVYYLRAKLNHEIENRKVNSQPACRLILNSHKMFSDLERLGCVERKSLTLQFPSEQLVPKHLMHHFVRGYFDGDGSLSITRRPRRFTGSIGFASSYTFCQGLQSLTLRYLGIKGHIRRATGQGFSFRIQGNIQIERIMDWIYQDATISLERKRTLYNIYKQEYQHIKTPIWWKRYGHRCNQYLNPDKVIQEHSPA